MLRLETLERFLPPPPVASPEGEESISDRIRHIAGVGVLWWYGSGPYFACARHCGENHVVSAATLPDALLQLERDLRATNRATLLEAHRLE